MTGAASCPTTSPEGRGRPGVARQWAETGLPAARSNGLGTLQSGGLAPGSLTRWLGRLPTWTAILVLAAFALLGVIFTLLAGQEPGTLLGVFVIMGSIAAALGIRRGKVYLLFPAPALAFFVAAIVTGKVHDAKLGSSTAGLGAGFTQWVAGIFFPAVIATILVLLIGGGRWVLGRQLITGQSPLSGGGRPAQGRARPAPSARPPRRRRLGRRRSFRRPGPPHPGDARPQAGPPRLDGQPRRRQPPPRPPAPRPAPGRQSHARPRPVGRPAPPARPQPAIRPPPTPKRPPAPGPPATQRRCAPVIQPGPGPSPSPSTLPPPTPRGLEPALREMSATIEKCQQQ